MILAESFLLLVEITQEGWRVYNNFGAANGNESVFDKEFVCLLN